MRGLFLYVVSLARRYCLRLLAKETVMDLFNEITDILLAFKVQPEIMGFDYLREGIRLCYQDSTLKNSITKKLYPKIAEKFGTTAETVERGMRTAVENSYNNGGLLEVNEKCGLIVYNNDFKWTNGEMITLLCELIRLKEIRERLDEQLENLKQA